MMRHGNPTRAQQPRLARLGLAVLSFLAIALTMSRGDGAETDWPQHLGPARNGISTETGLISQWPEGGPKEVWRVAGGVGMSGIAISGGHAVTLLQKAGRQWVLSLDAATGEEQWKTPVAKAYQNAMGDGPRGTPAIADARVFVMTGEGILAALQLTDGTINWSHDVVAELNGTVADYGMACSPIVIEGRVIVTPGAPGAAVVAFDALTGQLVWKAGDEPAGYSSPALLKLAGSEQLVVFSGAAVFGLDPVDGAVQWRHPYETNFDCNIATPVAVDGDVFVSAGENHGSALLHLVPRANGFDASEVWSSQGPKSVLRTEWQTTIVHDGSLYGFDNVGAAGPVTHLTCINARTGARVWQQLRFGKGNLIAADGKLLMTTMEGELVVARMSPSGYEELGRTTVLGPTRQAPSLAKGLLYLRDNDEIVCLDLRER